MCVVALASLGYEKTCVLFNAAALASQIAAEQNLDNDEGLKAAAKYYQVGESHHCSNKCSMITVEETAVTVLPRYSLGDQDVMNVMTRAAVIPQMPL